MDDKKLYVEAKKLYAEMYEEFNNRFKAIDKEHQDKINQLILIYCLFSAIQLS